MENVPNIPRSPLLAFYDVDPAGSSTHPITGKTANFINQCPFCGHWDLSLYSDDNGVSVTCNRCFSTGPVEPNAAAAKLSWNTRLRPIEGQTSLALIGVD